MIYRDSLLLNYAFGTHYNVGQNSHKSLKRPPLGPINADLGNKMVTWSEL